LIIAENVTSDDMLGVSGGIRDYEARLIGRVQDRRHHGDCDVRQRGDFEQVAHLDGHPLVRANEAVQRELIDYEPCSRRVLPVEHALLSCHPKGDYAVDDNPYWDAMMETVFHKRSVVMIAWLLTDYAVNKLIDMQDVLEDKMRKAAACDS
jgi:hypothetical protein